MPSIVHLQLQPLVGNLHGWMLIYSVKKGTHHSISNIQNLKPYSELFPVSKSSNGDREPICVPWPVYTRLTFRLHLYTGYCGDVELSSNANQSREDIGGGLFN